MLAIGRGVMQQGWVQKGCPELRFEEERTLFATWAIVSSPLVLSFDVTNDTEVARLWPIIGNEQALRINAQWAGEAGHLLKQSEESFNATDCGAGDMEVDAGKITLPLWAVWAKRLTDPQNGVAVLAINVGDTAQSVTITFDELLSELARIDPDLAARPPASLVGTDVWSGKATHRVSSDAPWREIIPTHDSTFLVFSATE